MINLVFPTYLVQKVPLNAISNEKTQHLCNLEVAENPFSIHQGGLGGCFSLSLGSPQPPKLTNKLTKMINQTAYQIKIPLYFSDIACHNPLNIKVAKDLFYGNEGKVVVNNFYTNNAR